MQTLMGTKPGYDEISSRTAAVLLGLSVRRIEIMCSLRVFESAYKPGVGEQAHWRLSRTEVLARKQHPELTKQIS